MVEIISANHSDVFQKSGKVCLGMGGKFAPESTLGLFLAEGLRKRIFDAGMKMSLEEILSHLGNIRKSTTISFTGKRGRPRVALQLEEMDETEKKLFDIVEKNPCLVHTQKSSETYYSSRFPDLA